MGLFHISIYPQMTSVVLLMNKPNLEFLFSSILSDVSIGCQLFTLAWRAETHK